MDKVKSSLQHFSGFISDEQIIDDLKQMKRTSVTDESVFSQKALDFLKNYELRKYNQLVKLSGISEAI